MKNITIKMRNKRTGRLFVKTFRERRKADTFLTRMIENGWKFLQRKVIEIAKKKDTLHARRDTC